MADRSPSKPRRSLTPDISLPPPSSSPSGNNDEPANTKISSTTAAPTKQNDPNPSLKQQQLTSQQPYSPGPTSSRPSHGGGVGTVGTGPAEESMDRSPSKPKRATSPAPPGGSPGTPVAALPPFPRGGGSIGRLRLSLREDPEAASEPRFGGHHVPTLLPRPPSSTGAAASAAPAASDLHPIFASSQLSSAQSRAAHSQQASPSYAPSQQWQASSALQTTTTMDDDSTQTWDYNESTQTFAYSLLDPPPAYSGGASLGGRRTPAAAEQPLSWPSVARGDRAHSSATETDTGAAPASASGAGAGAAAAALTAAEGQKSEPMERGSSTGDDEVGVAGAAAEGSAGAAAAAADSESPASSAEDTPTSASLSLKSLMGAAPPPPAAAAAATTTSPTTSRREHQQHRRRGDGNDRAADASLASSSTTFRPVLTMEVAPGVSRPLWHSDATRAAVAKGRARRCVCRGCGNALFAVRRAAYVLCPVCSTVGPLPSEGEGGGAESHEAAICVGVRWDDAPSSRS